MPFLIAILAVFVPASVLAQDAATVVTLPWGDWISDGIGWAAGIIGAAVLALFARLMAMLPATIQQIVRTFQVEQLLTRAVDYGLNAVAGAAKGQTLSVNVGSQVVAEAANYAVAQAPATLIGWLGGPDAVKRMILARIDLEPDASAAAVLR